MNARARARQIGLARSDDFMEAIIGAVFLTKGLRGASDFSRVFLDLK